VPVASNPTHIHIYTDGGYFEKLDVGGWGLVIYENNQEIYRDSGWQRQTSSLEMELFAAHQALKQLKHLESNSVCNTLYTDSRVVIEGLSEKYAIWCKNQWKVKSGKTVVYKELWQKISLLSEQHKIAWKWVKGHNGNQGNTLADQLARDAVMNRNNCA